MYNAHGLYAVCCILVNSDCGSRAPAWNYNGCCCFCCFFIYKYSSHSLLSPLIRPNLTCNIVCLMGVFTKFPRYKVSSIQSFLDTKCSRSKVSSIQSILDTQCPRFKVSSMQSFLDAKCPRYKVSSIQSGLDTKCPRYKV